MTCPSHIYPSSSPTPNPRARLRSWSGTLGTRHARDIVHAAANEDEHDEIENSSNKQDDEQEAEHTEQEVSMQDESSHAGDSQDESDTALDHESPTNRHWGSPRLHFAFRVVLFFLAWFAGEAIRHLEPAAPIMTQDAPVKAPPMDEIYVPYHCLTWLFAPDPYALLDVEPPCTPPAFSPYSLRWRNKAKEYQIPLREFAEMPLPEPDEKLTALQSLPNDDDEAFRRVIKKQLTVLTREWHPDRAIARKHQTGSGNATIQVHHNMTIMLNNAKDTLWNLNYESPYCTDFSDPKTRIERLWGSASTQKVFVGPEYLHEWWSATMDGCVSNWWKRRLTNGTAA